MPSARRAGRWAGLASAACGLLCCGLLCLALARPAAAYTYATLDDPLGANGTAAFGVNDGGQVVGLYFDAGNNAHGFLDTNGTFTTLDDPLGTRGTLAYGVSDGGQVAGYYLDANFLYHGFLDTGGVFTTLDDPLGTNGTFAYGVNDGGQTVGLYFDAGNSAHGFLATPSDAVPEPPPVALLGLGLLPLGWAARRRMRGASRPPR